MGNVVGKVLGVKKPAPFTPSAEQKSLEARQREQALEQESEIATREAMRKRSRSGRTSLLTGAATGVEDKQTTLG